MALDETPPAEEFPYLHQSRFGWSFLIVGFGMVVVYLASSLYLGVLRSWSWLIILSVAVSVVVALLVVAIVRAIFVCRLRLDRRGAVFFGVGYRVDAAWSQLTFRVDPAHRPILCFADASISFSPWLGWMSRLLAAFGLLSEQLWASMRIVRLDEFRWNGRTVPLQTPFEHSLPPCRRRRRSIRLGDEEESRMNRRFLEALAVVVFLGFDVSAQAAVPALSNAALVQQASLIALGRITSVSVVEVAPDWLAGRADIPRRKRGEFVDARYTITINVGSVEKGMPSLAGGELVFHAWRSVQRPRGWVGNTGTLWADPIKGETVKIYLGRKRAELGTPVSFRLQDPSGKVGADPRGRFVGELRMLSWALSVPFGSRVPIGNLES